MSSYDWRSEYDDYSSYDSGKFDYEECSDYDDELYSELDIVGEIFEGVINDMFISKVIRSDRNGVFIMMPKGKHYLTVKEVKSFKKRHDENNDFVNDY